MPPALSRQKDDNRIPAQLENVRKNRRQPKSKGNVLAREETRQESSLFGLVRAELEGLHTDSQHHLRCSMVSGASLWDWEMGHETKGELVPTTAAEGGIQGNTHAQVHELRPQIHKVERKTWTP